MSEGDGSDKSVVASWVVIGAEAVRQPEVRKVYQAMISEQLELLTKLIRETATEKGKKIAPKVAKELATTILATMEGAFQLSAAAEEIVPTNYADKTVRALLEAYLTQ